MLSNLPEGVELPTGTDGLKAIRDGQIGWVVFNRPERRNALSAEIWSSMPGAVAQFSADPEVRVIILRGAGKEAFAAGADISEFDENRAGAAAAQAYEGLNLAAFQALRDCPKPVIAMIAGYCIGGGLAVALACDMRISSETANFALPPARLGLAYPLAGLRQLLSAVSPSFAKDMIFTARRLTGPEAREAGLVSRLVPIERLESETRIIAGTLSENAPLTIAAAKFMIDKLAENPDTIDPRAMGELSAQCFDSDDYQEGRTAFLEKRKPHFRGR